MTLFELPQPAEEVDVGGARESDAGANSTARAAEDVEDTDSSEAGPPGPLQRVRLDVAYDGTAFHGFAAQPGVRTVGGELVAALSEIARHQVEIVCAGRTDSGVHATGQVVHVDVPVAVLERPRRRRGAGGGPGSYAGMDNGATGGSDGGAGEASGVDGGAELAWLSRALSHRLGPEIAVSAARPVREDFHARFSAVARRYRYDVLNRPAPAPLLARTSWHVEDPLELGSMRLACDVLLGEHDFSAFCRRPDAVPAGTPIVRRVTEAGWSRPRHQEGLLRFEIEGNAFCHHMVRSLVGALVAVGKGRLKAARVGEMLASGERRGSPGLAPAAGLCLIGVRYPGE